MERYATVSLKGKPTGAAAHASADMFLTLKPHTATYCNVKEGYQVDSSSSSATAEECEV